MKLQLRNFNFMLDLEENINVIVIENKIEYRKFVNSFVNELNIRDGNILLSKDIELLVPEKYIFTFYDYFTFDINKYALNKFYKKLKEISMVDFSFEISCDLDVTEILKSLNVKIKQYSELLLDKIINYINVINEIFGIKYFVFISLKEYFSDREIIDFYNYINYNDFKVVLVEPNNKNNFQTKEKIYVIDEDLCEIY